MIRRGGLHRTSLVRPPHWVSFDLIAWVFVDMCSMISILLLKIVSTVMLMRVGFGVFTGPSAFEYSL